MCGVCVVGDSLVLCERHRQKNYRVVARKMERGTRVCVCVCVCVSVCVCVFSVEFMSLSLFLSHIPPFFIPPPPPPQGIRGRCVWATPP